MPETEEFDYVSHLVQMGTGHLVTYEKPVRVKKKNPIGFSYDSQPAEKSSSRSSADERDPAKVEDEGSNPSEDSVV